MPFISIEGCEASGKSTQTLVLKQHLEALGHRVFITKEPGGTPLADKIRSILLSSEINDSMTEFLLISAARRDHILHIQGLLAGGAWVITDRFTDSSRVYQGIVKGLDQNFIDFCIKSTTCGIVPDLTLLLDVEIDVMMARIAASGDHHSFYDNKEAAFHQQIKNGFLLVAKQHQDRIKVVDANCDVDMVSRQILAILQEKFNV